MSNQLSPEQRKWNISPTPIYHQPSHAYNLIYSHISRHPDWPISTLYAYCEKYYDRLGFTREIFCQACKAYINSLPDSNL